MNKNKISRIVMDVSWKVILILCFIILLPDCVTQKKCLEKFPPGTDSVYIEKLKKVPVYLPGDTIRLSTPANCPDQDLVSMENSKLKQTISILNGKLLAITIIKPDTVVRYVPQIIEKVKEVPQPVKYVPKFYKYCVGALGILVFALIIYFGLKIYFKFRGIKL
jgi:hypothetical protein